MWFYVTKNIHPRNEGKMDYLYLRTFYFAKSCHISVCFILSWLLNSFFPSFILIDKHTHFFLRLRFFQIITHIFKNQCSLITTSCLFCSNLGQLPSRLVLQLTTWNFFSFYSWGSFSVCWIEFSFSCIMFPSHIRKSK